MGEDLIKLQQRGYRGRSDRDSFIEISIDALLRGCDTPAPFLNAPPTATRELALLSTGTGGMLYDSTSREIPMYRKCIVGSRIVTASVLAIAIGLWTASPTLSADDSQLQAIGSLAAAHVYTSYGYVGVTADAFVADSFTANQVTDLMTEVTEMIDLNVEALQKVRASVGDDDQEFLDDLVRVYRLVKREAQALVIFARSKHPEDAAAFEKSRKAVWPHLKNLLGIE